MAATNPSDPYRSDERMDRATMSSVPAPARRSKWLWAVIAVLVIAVIAVVAYMLLYNGGGGGYGGGGGAGDGGAYAVVAFSGDAIRRVARRLKR